MTEQELIARLRVDEPACEEHFTANLAADRIEELVKERDELGRKLNTSRYGQPDFAWSIHEEAMADLRAKLTKAVEALKSLHHAVCGETGFAAAVRNYSGIAYPWEPLDIADEQTRAVLAELEGK